MKRPGLSNDSLRMSVLDKLFFFSGRATANECGPYIPSCIRLEYTYKEISTSSGKMFLQMSNEQTKLGFDGKASMLFLRSTDKSTN